MKFKHIVLKFLMTAFLISGCANNSENFSARPVWIENPGKGVSASAGMHVGGRMAQEELAILRGREEYAKRFGISIQSELISSTTVANDKSSSVALKVVHENANQVNIKVLVKEKWRDPSSDELWVWLIPSD